MNDTEKELARLRKIETEYQELRTDLLQDGTGYSACEHCGRIKFEDDLTPTEAHGWRGPVYCDRDECQRACSREERECERQSAEDSARRLDILTNGLGWYLGRN